MVRSDILEVSLECFLEGRAGEGGGGYRGIR